MEYTKSNHPLRNWTPEGIISGHRLLWQDIALKNLIYKDSSDVLQKLGLDEYYAESFKRCFMCMITYHQGSDPENVFYCKPRLCPIKWGTKKEAIHCEHGYYGKWINAENRTRRHWAKKIRDLPIDRDKVASLLNSLMESLPD